MVARSGAALLPLGPGQKASQPVHHHPPQRYKPGRPAPVFALTKKKTRIRVAVADHKRHLADERAAQISLDVVVAWAAEPRRMEGKFRPEHFLCQQFCLVIN